MADPIECAADACHLPRPPQEFETVGRRVEWLRAEAARLKAEAKAKEDEAKEVLAEAKRQADADDGLWLCPNHTLFVAERDRAVAGQLHGETRPQAMQRAIVLANQGPPGRVR